MAGIDSLAGSIMQLYGKGNFTSKGNSGSRVIYPAVVTSTDDPLGQNRIKARIISLDDNEEIVGGKDKDKTDENLVYCYPLVPEFFHVRPIAQQKDSDGNIITQGEMVWLILENPSDDTAPRYWIGPIISSQIKLKFQSYSEAIQMTDITSFNLNLALNNSFKSNSVLPQQSDVAVQGRDDADLILKPRELFLTAGKFIPNTIEINTISPSNIRLKQFENNQIGPLKTFSQANIQSTNINIFSPLGKFRDKNLSKFEVNENLKSYGDLASSLHPAVFGDELVKLLDIIIRVLLTHVHTPQSPLVPIPESITLQSYSIKGELQNLLSNVFRIN